MISSFPLSEKTCLPDNCILPIEWVRAINFDTIREKVEFVEFLTYSVLNH
jgi:hypothetical protein